MSGLDDGTGMVLVLDDMWEAIGMSMLPEEFPVVLTVFLAMGAWRIGKVGGHVVDRGHEPAQALGGDRAAGARRVDTGAMQRLAHIDIAEASDDTLVEQQLVRVVAQTL